MRAYLKEHPKLKWHGIRTWPPWAGGSHQTGERYLTPGEGKLADVRLWEEDYAGPRRLGVTVEHLGRKYSGQVPADEPEVVTRLYEFLKGQLDRPLSDISNELVDL